VFEVMSGWCDCCAVEVGIECQRWEIVLHCCVVNPLGEPLALLDEIEVRSFDKLKGIFLIVADQPQRSLRREDHFGDEFGPVGNGRFRRGQPALDRTVNTCTGGELSESLIYSEKILRDLEHGGVDGA